MSKRLLDDGATDLEALLLRAGQADTPPDPALRARTIEGIKTASQTALLVGGGILGVRWLTSAWSVLPKWAVLAGIGVAATAAVAFVAAPREPSRTAVTVPVAAVGSTSSAPRSVASTPPEGTVVTRPAPAPALAPVLASADRISDARPKVASAAPSVGIGPAKQPTVSEAPSVEPRPVATVKAPDRTPDAAPAMTLREETAQLAAVRRLVESSRATDALAALDRYGVQHPAGMLNEEAAVLRVEALLAAARVAEARVLVSRFEGRYPTSSYGPRLRALVEKE